MRYGYFIVKVDYISPLFTAIMSRMIGRQYLIIYRGTYPQQMAGYFIASQYDYSGKRLSSQSQPGARIPSIPYINPTSPQKLNRLYRQKTSSFRS